MADATPKELPVLVNGGMTSRSIKEVGSRITARAIVLDDGKTQLAMVVVDSCMLPRAFLDEVKVAVNKRTGIRTDKQFICATHTHSAPSCMGALGTSRDPRYPMLLKRKIIEAVVTAQKNLETAQVGVAVFDAKDFTALRRWVIRPDRVRNDPFGNPTVRATMHAGGNWDDVTGETGPEDPDFSLVSFQSLKGRPIAVLGNFSMHYFSGGIRGVNADYFGMFNDRMELAPTPSNNETLHPPFVSALARLQRRYWRRDYTSGRWQSEDRGLHRCVGEEGLSRLQKNKIQTRRHVGHGANRFTTEVSRSTRKCSSGRAHVAKTDGLPKTQPEIYAREQIFLHERPEATLCLQAIRIGDIGLTGIPNEVYALTGETESRQPAQHHHHF